MASYFVSTSTATSTFAGGINLTSGCIALNGSCFAGSSLTLPVSIANGGTATSSQVANGVNFYNGTEVGSAANFSYNGTLLTVGTTSAPSLTIPRGIYVGGADTSSSNYTFVVSNSNNSPILRVRNDSRVGINGAPGSSFSVNGNASVGSTYVGLGGGTNALIVEGNIGAGTSTPSHKLTASNTSAPQLALTDGNASDFLWTARAINNNLYFATSTHTATSSVAAFSINSNGQIIIPQLVGCDTIDTTAAGVVTCGTDATGGAGTGPATSTNPLMATYVVATGTAATSTFAGGVSISGGVAVGTSTPGTLVSWQGIANFVSGAISTIYNGLKVLTELIIPSSTAPSLSNGGDIAINTTAASSSLDYHDGSAQRHLYAEKTITFAYSTTTTVAGTTTLQIMGAIRQQTYTQMGCVSTGGTFNIQIGTGSASSTMVTSTSLTGAGSATFTTLSTNNTFNKGQVKYISFGTPSATGITQLSCSMGVRDEL